MKCPKCGHENPDQAKFCMDCGTRLENVCPECGTKLPSGAKFCMECGTKISGQSIATQEKPMADMVIPRLEDMQAQIYIPEPLRNRMDVARQEMVGENRLVTAIFADISGFTLISQTMDGEAVVEKVNECIQVIYDAVYRYEGSVNRYFGDCVLAFFGAPLAHENDPERAILAAMEMRDTISEIGLRISVGINTGMMYFGPVGIQKHLEISAYGIDVILAQRLQLAAQPGQILVGRNTYGSTRRAFEFENMPPIELKGIENPGAIYAAVKPLSKPEKIRGIEGLKAKLIGREEELNKLEEALIEVVKGSGQMVSIIGEAGVGKSRLVSELKESALATGDYELPFWLEGRCLSLGITASYWPFIEMFREYFGWGTQEKEETRGKMVISSLQDMLELGDLSENRYNEIGPFLGNLLSIKFGNKWDEKIRDFTPDQIKSQTFLAIRDFFVAVARRKPVVLVFEDLHWADGLSLDLIPFSKNNSAFHDILNTL